MVKVALETIPGLKRNYGLLPFGLRWKRNKICRHVLCLAERLWISGRTSRPTPKCIDLRYTLTYPVRKLMEFITSLRSPLTVEKAVVFSQFFLTKKLCFFECVH